MACCLPQSPSFVNLYPQEIFQISHCKLHMHLNSFCSILHLLNDICFDPDKAGFINVSLSVAKGCNVLKWNFDMAPS